MAIQVQMRGGSSTEHENFVGANREVTVDTTFSTLRVHDGKTLGGNPLATVTQLNNTKEVLQNEIEQLQMDLSKSHNHDDKYSKLTHTHSQYVEKKNGTKGLVVKSANGYNGLALEDGSDTDYVRTTKNGLIPYQSGSYSNIGTSSWRFTNGFFHYVNANKFAVNSGEIDFNGTAGKINFFNDDYLKYNDDNNEYQFTSDGDVNKSRVKCGHIEINGRRIYIGSSFPSDARTNDILIQI